MIFYLEKTHNGLIKYNLSLEFSVYRKPVKIRITTIEDGLIKNESRFQHVFFGSRHAIYYVRALFPEILTKKLKLDGNLKIQKIKKNDMVYSAKFVN